MDLRSSAVIPAAEEVRPPPPPPPIKTARTSSADMTPRAPMPSYSDAAASADVAERVQAILNNVLASTLAPVIEKQRELEARLETLKAMPVRATAKSIDITGSLSPPAPSVAPKMISTSYGLVSVMPGPPPRSEIEKQLENVGPIDVPDFAGNRKFIGRIVITLLVLGVVGAIVATMLSYR